MIRRIQLACGAEWTKYSRMPMPYLGIAIVIGLSAATALIHPIRHDGISDFGFIGHAVPAALNLAGFLIVLGYAATLVSSEVASGTIRTMLVRPLARHEYLAAKLINGMTYAVLLAFASLITAWICVVAFGELTGVAFGDELMFTTVEVYGAMALAALLNLAPHFASVAYGLFLSTITHRPAAAVGLAAGTWLLLDYVKYPLGISPFLFTTYLDQSWIVFQDRCNALDTPYFPETIYGALICVAWFVVFGLAAAFVFGRRSFGP